MPRLWNERLHMSVGELFAIAQQKSIIRGDNGEVEMLQKRDVVTRCGGK